MAVSAHSAVSLRDRFQDHARAEAELKRALQDSAQDPLPLWLAMGRLKLSQNLYSDAQDWFEKVKEREPEHPGALYYLGICHREIGTFSAFFMRANQWNIAESLFSRLIEIDSTYEDVHFQMAQLQRYRKKYAESLEWVLRGLRGKPRRISINLGMHGLFRSFLLNVQTERALLWLKSRNDPEALFYLGELERQRGNYTRADSIYNRLLEQNLLSSDMPVHLARFRLQVQGSDPLAGEADYWRAVEKMDDSLEARLLFEDLKLICTENEITEFINCSTPSQWDHFFKTFWTRRDPMPARPANLRLVEHYRRLVYVEENYRYDGFRTWNANPDQQEFLQFPRVILLNHEFNDKGLIYLRHGEPDDKATALGATLAYNESWQYSERDGFPKMIFHFEIDEDGLAGDWRLTPMLSDSSAIDAVVLWDPAYARYLRGNMTVRNRVANEIAHVSRDRVSLAMETDRHSWSGEVEPLPVDFSIANFYQNRSTNLCEVSLAFPVDEMLEESGVSRVDIGVAVHDMNWREREIKREILQIDPEHSQKVDGEFVHTFRLFLRSEPYYLAFHVDPLNSPELGGSKLRLTLPNFSGRRLLCSDIQLAHRIEARDSSQTISKNNMQFLANPSGRVSRARPLLAYLEIYHLTRDERGRSSYRVTTTLEDLEGTKRGGFLGLFGRKKSARISTASERNGFSTGENEVVRLDLSKIESGRKRLTIEVTDLLNGDSDLAEIECILE